VPLGSADNAFGIIAVQRKLLTKEACAAQEKLLESKLQGGASGTLAEQLVTAGLVEAKDAAEVERIRSKHGRACEACAKTTFLLPGESAQAKPCEHCGGKLKAGAVAAPQAPPPAPRPASPGPVARPQRTGGLEVARPTGKIDRTRAGTFSEEPAKPRSSMDEQLAEAERNERARKLRMAGAFGYEPSPPAAPAPEPAPAPPAEPVPPAEVAAAAPDPAPAFSRPAQNSVLGGWEPPPDPAIAMTSKTFTDEAKAVLLYPLNKGALPLVCIGAVVGGLIGGIGLRWSLFMLLYYWAFQVKVLDRVTAGKIETPDWSDVTDLWELLYLGGRVLLCNVACYIFAFLCLLGPFIMPSHSGPVVARVSVGPEAASMAGHGKNVGNDASEEEFQDTDDHPVKISEFKGKWLVLGLVGVDKDFSGGGLAIGMGGEHETYDLDRVARASGKDTVVGAILIDPGKRVMKGWGLVPPPPDEERGSPSVEKEEEGFERTKLPASIDPANLGRAKSAWKGPPEVFAKLKVLRWTEGKLGPAFGGSVGHAPTVWIVGPDGKIRKEWDSGADDHAIWGALQHLRRGGNGDRGPARLPGEPATGLDLFEASVGFWLMAFFFFVLVGAVYHPMAFLMTVVFTNGFLAFNYPAALGAISRTRRDYLSVVALLIIVGIVGQLMALLVGLVCTPLPEILAVMVQGIARWWVILYTLIAEAYALGRFYVRQRRALAWFE
jgi:hypothetical protein